MQRDERLDDLIAQSEELTLSAKAFYVTVRSCVRLCVRSCVRLCVRSCVRLCVRLCVRSCVRLCVCSCEWFVQVVCGSGSFEWFV